LITGHTGFKGSRLAIWLTELGAEVTGFSLPAADPGLYMSTRLEKKMHSIEGDIRNKQSVYETVALIKPDIIFHLAAQPLVLDSYINPVDTFEINAQGSVHILEAGMRTPSVKAMVMITTDKVYENYESLQGYKEEDRLGGKDPYSASKAMAEIAIASYRKSFAETGEKSIGIASARAGNVIGGGDFAENRLVPDIMRALFHNRSIYLRNPQSVRPWIHALEPLSGYLWLGYCLLTDPKKYSQAWNFSPPETEAISCRQLAKKIVELWGNDPVIEENTSISTKEMNLLRLNGEKTAELLQWKPIYHGEESLQYTVEWYKEYISRPESDLYEFCVSEIKQYTFLAKQRNAEWAKAYSEHSQRMMCSV